MFSILIRPTAANYDAAIATLWEHGTVGLIEESETIRAFFEDRSQATAASQDFKDILLELRQEDPCVSYSPDTEACDPIWIGERFIVAPAGVAVAAPAGRFRISMEAQSAFGSGRHESTQLTMQALELCLQPGMSVLDVGCGSGILAIAARLLGANNIFVCDIDANAIALVRAVDGLSVFAGSADAIQTAAVDLVLANISNRILDAIAPDLQRVARPSAKIIISGFMRDQPPRRFQPQKILENADWQCWICDRDPHLAAQVTIASPHPLQWW